MLSLHDALPISSRRPPSLTQLRDQRLRRGGIGHLRARDEEEIDVAAALRPAACAVGPMVERLVVIAGFDILPAALQARIGEVGGLLVDAGKFVAVGEDDGHVPPAREVDEGGVAEAFVPHLKRSEEHTSELQSLMRTSYAVFCLKK